tara:strand:+ start:196 stop:342 length:147 start_codon:yes stop_codon:yes gene_type:complete
MSKPRRSKLWIWIVVAFVLQIAAWTIWLRIAGQNPVEEVPLATPTSSR